MQTKSCELDLIPTYALKINLDSFIDPLTKNCELVNDT